MRAFATDRFALPLPPGHRFPVAKYGRLRERLVAEAVLPPADIGVPPAATDGELALAHDPGYVARVVTGRLTAAELRVLGLPWSPELVERARRSVGATLAASRAALEEGVGVSLAGGTHHAFRDRGEGFCVFNDAVVAARVLQAEGAVARIAVVDLDVHQGNGTASLAAGDETLFTLSVHGARNYPARKERSDLDVALPDGTRDEPYLAAVADALERALDLSGAELVLYLAGADPWEGDRLGRLAVSKRGLVRRDELVLRCCRRRGLAVAVTMGGGYPSDVNDVVDIHVGTVRAAATAAAEAAAGRAEAPRR